ncbi:MAG: Rnf-Nqr domain containing protein [Oscillospiraceae bacterium]|jgi:electron transport complex protein RnfE
MSSKGRSTRLNRSFSDALKEDVIFVNNPVFISGLGLAPLIVVVNSVRSAIIISIAVAIMSIITRPLASLLCINRPQRAWPSLYVLVAAISYIPALMLLEQLYTLNSIRIAVGLYLPLLAADEIVISRSAIPVREPIGKAFVHGLNTAIGFAVAAFIIGALREMLGSGTFMGNPIVLGTKFRLLTTAGGGFLIIGLLAALWQYLVGIYKDLASRGGDKK